MTLSTFINPFDFKTVIINFFLGSQALFIFTFAILMGVVSAKFNMPPKIFGIITIVSAIIFAVFLGQSILLLIGVIIAFVIYTALKRIMQW